MVSTRSSKKSQSPRSPPNRYSQRKPKRNPKRRARSKDSPKCGAESDEVQPRCADSTDVPRDGIESIATKESSRVAESNEIQHRCVDSKEEQHSGSGELMSGCADSNKV